MNNSVYGKTLENVEKYKDINVCHQTDFTKRSANKMHYYEVLSIDLAIVYNHKVNVGIHKPCYVGAKILDLSKLLMYKMYYDRLKSVFMDRIELVYMDSDSSILLVKS